MNNKEMQLAQLIQKDIDAVSRPFENIAQKLKRSEADVIQSIKKLSRDGLIRKFGAILRHNKAGYKTNALIVWSVPAQQVEKVGTFFSSFLFVSHCYERKPSFRNKYNLFTMIHSQTEDIDSLVRELSASSKINDFLILKSIEEYKKTSPEYF
jgi:DNA-binding Lrp family transcriptional regulator